MLLVHPAPIRRLAGLAALLIAAAVAAAADDPPRVRILDAQPRFIVLTGGPHLVGDGAKSAKAPLVELIERHYGGKCPHQFAATHKKIVNRNPTDGVKSWVELVKPELERGKASKLPVVVLTYLPPHLLGLAEEELRIRKEDDRERIKLVADVMEDYLKQVRAAGADLVVFTDGARGSRDLKVASADKTMIHYRLGYEEADRRQLPGIVMGPRIHKLGLDHPHLFARDQHHILEAGKRAIALRYFQALCELDGVPAPAWSQKELAEVLKK